MSAADFRMPPADKEAFVSVEHVSKFIKRRTSETIILTDVSFRVPVGSLFAVRPSGSGKSTLLNMLTGIDRPSSGHVLFDGEALRAKSEDELARWRGQHVGIVFQFFQLIPTLTPLENVILALELGSGKRLARRVFRERAMRCLELARVEMLAHRLPG
jgi:predicted ABC-type transport system involved in lysophospholipase L1 biosynthesis ATPase subunit